MEVRRGTIQGNYLSKYTYFHPDMVVAVIQPTGVWQWIKQVMCLVPKCPMVLAPDCQNFKPVVPQKTEEELIDENYGILPEDTHGTILAKVMLKHGTGVKRASTWVQPIGSDVPGCLMGMTSLGSSFSWRRALREEDGFGGTYEWWNKTNDHHAIGPAPADLLAKVVAL